MTIRQKLVWWFVLLSLALVAFVVSGCAGVDLSPDNPYKHISPPWGTKKGA